MSIARGAVGTAACRQAVVRTERAQSVRHDSQSLPCCRCAWTLPHPGWNVDLTSRSFITLGAVVILVLASACAPPREHTNRQPSTISSTAALNVRIELEARGSAFSAAVVRASSSGWAAPQIDSLAAFYTDSTIIFPPRGEPIRGRDAVRQYWTRPTDRRILAHAIHIERVEASESGDLAAEYGQPEIVAQQGADSAAAGRATYISVWRRDRDGVWRKHLDSWW